VLFSLVVGGLSMSSMTSGQAQLTWYESFDGTNGDSPFAGVTISGTTLYGVTVDGGSSNVGALYSLPKTGGAFTTLNNFIGNPTDFSPNGF
jgi:uncharacterized repeat protein (TIGR03803 family)